MGNEKNFMKFLKDFYPKSSFTKVAIFKLNKNWAYKGTNIMIFLLKKQKGKEKVLGNELYFNGKDFAQISFGEFRQENLEGLFRTMKDMSSKHIVIKFFPNEKISSQENKILNAFEKFVIRTKKRLKS